MCVCYTVSYSTVGSAGKDAGQDDEERNIIAGRWVNHPYNIAWKASVTTTFLFDRRWLSTSGAFLDKQIHCCAGVYYDVHLACMLHFLSTVSASWLRSEQTFGSARLHVTIVVFFPFSFRSSSLSPFKLRHKHRLITCPNHTPSRSLVYISFLSSLDSLSRTTPNQHNAATTRHYSSMLVLPLFANCFTGTSEVASTTNKKNLADR